MDWETVAAAGAFVAGVTLGAVITVRVTRAVWDSAYRARRRLEDDTE